MAQSAQTLWLPLMEFSQQTGISLSTLRRYIKSGKLSYRVDKGKYLIAFEGEPKVQIPLTPAQTSAPSEIEGLKLQLLKAQEEIEELKLLVSLYESQAPQFGGHA